MNLSETRDMVSVFDRMRPAYADWRMDQAKKLAAMHGTDPKTELRAIIEGMARALSEIDTGEAADVLCEMETGDCPIPPYGELAASIRSHALDNRRGRAEAERYRRDTEPRYRCLDCQDRGNVLAYNPAFLRWLRPTLAERRRTGGLAWYYRARAEWNRRCVQAASDGERGQSVAPAEIGLVCRCDCHEANVYRRQLTAMVESMRDQSAKPRRAAYIGQWTEGRQCLVIDHGAELDEWFAEHDDAADFAWQPNPGDYAARFGGEE